MHCTSHQPRSQLCHNAPCRAFTKLHEACGAVVLSNKPKQSWTAQGLRNEPCSAPPITGPCCLCRGKALKGLCRSATGGCFPTKDDVPSGPTNAPHRVEVEWMGGTIASFKNKAKSDCFKPCMSPWAWVPGHHLPLDC